MMYTREELVKISKQYFKDGTRKEMFATNDGNFFYEEAYAHGHRCNNKALKVEIISQTEAMAIDQEELDTEIVNENTDENPGTETRTRKIKTSKTK